MREKVKRSAAYSIDFDIELPQKRKNRRKFTKEIDGTNLTVVVKERKNAKEALVITTFWNS